MKEEIRYLSNNGVDTIYATVWHNADHVNVPIGVVQIVHGMSEYVERYEELANYLTTAGFIVCGEDHLGHGRSAGKNGLGYFAPRGGWNFMVEDTYMLTEIMKKRYPTLPYFVLGHSMGSFMARIYATRYGDTINGLLLSGTAGPNRTVPAALLFARFQRKTKGEFYKSTELDKMMFANYNRAYDPVVTDKDWLTRDTEICERYIADEYCGFLFTTSACVDLFKMIEQVSTPDWAIRVPKHLPIYLYSGDMDPVGDYGRGVKTVYSRLKGAGVADVSLKLYEDGRHEMHNELNREEVYKDIAEWMFVRI